MTTVRPLIMDDFPQWLPLWTANNLGHSDADVTAQTWARIVSNGAAVYGFGAFDGDTLVGLAHYVLHPTTGALADAAYLQDVFVTPETRGKGIAKKLVNAVIKRGKDEKWSRLYWLAERQNEAAQALYKNIAKPIDFTVHLLPL